MIGLKYIRSIKGISLADIAYELDDISNQAVSAWENGKKPIPKKRLKQLSEIFKIPEEYFQKELSKNDMFMIAKYNCVNENDKMYQMLKEIQLEDGPLASKTKNVFESVQIRWNIENNHDKETYSEIFNGSYLRFLSALDEVKISFLEKMLESEGDIDKEFSGIGMYVRIIQNFNSLFCRDGSEFKKLKSFLSESVKNMNDETEE